MVNFKKCSEKREKRKKVCAEKREKRKKKCNNWVSWMQWLCKGFTEIISFICVAWNEIVSFVCVAWTYITNIICVSWVWIVSFACASWTWIISFVCVAWTIISEIFSNWISKDGKYFPCKIYNTSDRRKDKPSFAILSMIKNFGIEETIIKVKNTPPKNIFIIVNGQQALNLSTNNTKDEQYGQALTGSDKVGDKYDDFGVWKGKYKIHITSSYQSVASTTFDKYGKDDLIIDIVNAKYEWEESAKKNKKAFDNFCKELKTILSAIGDCSQLRFFVAGFSRGGMFSLKLAEWLVNNNYGKERIVVTIDPVQNYSKEGKEWDVGWVYWNIANKKWEKSSGNERPHIGKNKYKFPILKSPAEKHYNVFERDSVLFNQCVDSPIGGAVEGSIAPPKNLTGERNESSDKKYRKLPSGISYDQFDILNRNHTEMPKKYRDWIIEIIDKQFSIKPIKYDAVKKLPKLEIFIQDILNLHDKNQPKFVKHKQIKDYRILQGAKIKIKGKFESNDKIILNNKNTVTEYYENSGESFLLFTIPKNMGVGKTNIIVKHKQKLLNTPFSLIICDLIGNKNEMELHKPDCKWLSRIKPSNMELICSFIDKPKENGYDNCHWCLGGSLR